MTSSKQGENNAYKTSGKMDRVLQYLKLKIFPNTLFFRTMLMIFIPLILVQVVSVIAFFNGNWEKVGRRLSDNLSNNIAVAVEMTSQIPICFRRFKNCTKAVTV